MMERLRDTAVAGGNKSVTFASVRKGMHNDTWAKPNYPKIINDFLLKTEKDLLIPTCSAAP
jgi:hypothetical protein